MIGLSRFVQGDMGPQGVCQSLIVLLPGQLQGFVRGGRGFGKPARFGIGGGQRIQQFRLPAATELLGPLGMFDRLGAVSQPGCRAGRL